MDAVCFVDVVTPLVTAASTGAILIAALINAHSVIACAAAAIVILAIILARARPTRLRRKVLCQPSFIHQQDHHSNCIKLFLWISSSASMYRTCLLPEPVLYNPHPISPPIFMFKFPTLRPV